MKFVRPIPTRKLKLFSFAMVFFLTFLVAYVAHSMPWREPPLERYFYDYAAPIEDTVPEYSKIFKMLFLELNFLDKKAIQGF
jgi:hypothetical protein